MHSQNILLEKLPLPMLNVDGRKIPLPMIKVEDVAPDDYESKKCSPGTNFENGSCYTLEILGKMAIAFNNHVKDEKEKIILDGKLAMTHPTQYKLYLLSEFKKRHEDLTQKEWLELNFMKTLPDEIKEGVFRPSGPQGRYEWLSTLDINNVLEQYENKYKDFKFLGAVPIDFDDLDGLGIKNLDFNELIKNNINRVGIVFNLDEHYKSGSHWVSLFFDLSKGQIYFSDSYGTEPDKRILKFINRIKNFLENKKISVDYKYNKFQHQKGNSECGVYSINFIIRLLKGKSFDHITQKRVSDDKVNKCRLIYFSNANFSHK
jgi:hypothetical protein